MRGQWLRRSGFGLAAVAVVFSVVLASRFGADPGLVESPLIGQAAPEFTLDSLEGNGSVSLVDMRGQIVVVNFFASWCPECRAEHADLVASSDAFAADASFVQISYQESPETSWKWLKEVGTSSNTAYLADDRSRTAIAYGVFGIPETFFIDANGVVVGKIIGEADALSIGATIDAIKRGESPGQTVAGETRQGPKE